MIKIPSLKLISRSPCKFGPQSARKTKPSTSVLQNGIYFGQISSALNSHRSPIPQPAEKKRNNDIVLRLVKSLKQSKGLSPGVKMRMKTKESKLQIIEVSNPHNATIQQPTQNQQKGQACSMHQPNLKLTNSIFNLHNRKIALSRVQQDDELTRYQVQGIIAKGRFAVVQLGIDKQTGRRVAIKSYDKHKLQDQRNKNHVRQEIAILSQLDHPNIIKLLVSITTPSTINLVTNYIGSQCLRIYLKDHNYCLSDQIVLNIFKQVISALVYLHDKNIVHRDVKLENILIDDREHIFLIDFGFSVIQKEPLSDVCGTPTYMAPEMMSKSEYDGKAADMWACGVLLYVLFEGRFPFEGNSDQILFTAVQEGCFNISNQLSGWGKALIINLLQTQPDKRLTALQVQQMLQ